jgi:hypothetical protein
MQTADQQIALPCLYLSSHQLLFFSKLNSAPPPPPTHPTTTPQLRYLSFLYWGFNILTKIQFRRHQLYNCGGAVPSTSTAGYSSQALAAIPGCTPVGA